MVGRLSIAYHVKMPAKINTTNAALIIFCCFMSILLFMYPPSLAGPFFVYEVLELLIDPPFQRVGKEHVPFIELLHAIRAVLCGL